MSNDGLMDWEYFFVSPTQAVETSLPKFASGLRPQMDEKA